LEFGEEFFEFFAVLGGDDEFGGGESVLARVLGGAGLASLGPGTGAEMGIGCVDGLACF
jgi:hypothetical protein